MLDISKNVDLYIRVSTTEQAEEGFSVEEQENKLRAYCQAYNFNIYRVCVDPGVSGATMERPGLTQLINDVENKRCSCVLVWKLDRLSRSQKDTLILLEDIFLANDCNFISLMESFDTSSPLGRCIIGVLAAFAQMERENIKMRTSMGRIARIRKGYYSGTICPIGYKFKEGCNDLIVDPYHAEIVKDIYKLYLSGIGLSATGRAIMDKYGNTDYDWTNNTAVRRVLMNPVYMGKVKHTDELYDGLHEAIISESDWYRTAALLEHNKEINKRSYSFKTKNSYADNLLTGLLICGDCGARMYARKISKKSKKYICHSVARTSPLMIKSDHCTNRLHPYTVAQLDNIILDEIRKLSLDRTYFDSMRETYQDANQASIPDLQTRLDSINKQSERLITLYQSGLVEIDNITSRLGELRKEKEALINTINEIKSTETDAAFIDEAWKQLQSFSTIVDSGDTEAVHLLVHSLIDKIEVLNEDITIYWSFC